MTIQIEPMEQLEHHARRLGCSLPNGISLFPRNFEDADNLADLVFDDCGLTLTKYWKKAGLDEQGLLKDQRKYLMLRSDLPVICIFIGWTAISQDPISIQLAIGVAGNYLTDLCKGFKKPAESLCTLTIIRERVTKSKRRFDKITYSGPVDGLSEVLETLKVE